MAENNAHMAILYIMFSEGVNIYCTIFFIYVITCMVCNQASKIWFMVDYCNDNVLYWNFLILYCEFVLFHPNSSFYGQLHCKAWIVYCLFVKLSFLYLKSSK